MKLLGVTAFLLGTTVAATAAMIPLPRARPVDIPADTEAVVSPCRSRLAEVAAFKPLPPITGPGDCTATDVVALDAVLLSDNHRVIFSPTATLRCPMAEAVTHWVRNDVAPIIATLGKSLRGVETLDSFDCRRRNGIADAKISEHGHANALDVRAFKLANGSAMELADASVAKSLREKLRQSACARFSTVLGNGADAYHDSHVHLDLIERSNNYRICQWDVLDVTETAALAAKKAATAAASIPSVVPLPRPRPVVKTVLSDRPRYRIVHLREGARGPLFGLFAPLVNSMH
ncbi:MAG TPA: extensin family protein [Terriglobales bacterium]|nr:extensin family protein [Terriglobales bacterium]